MVLSTALIGQAEQYDPLEEAEGYQQLHAADGYPHLDEAGGYHLPDEGEQYDPLDGAEECQPADQQEEGHAGDAAACNRSRLPEQQATSNTDRPSVFARLQAVGSQQQLAAAATGASPVRSPHRTPLAAADGEGLEQQGGASPATAAAAAADASGRASILDRLTFQTAAASTRQPDGRPPAAAESTQDASTAGKPKHPRVQPPEPAAAAAAAEEGEGIRRATSSGQEHGLASRLSSSSLEGTGSGPLSRQHSAGAAGERSGPAGRPFGVAVRGLQAWGLLGGLAKPRALTLGE